MTPAMLDMEGNRGRAVSKVRGQEFGEKGFTIIGKTRGGRVWASCDLLFRTAVAYTLSMVFSCLNRELGQTQCNLCMS